MTDVAIGVHVHAEPHRLRATLDSLGRHTSTACECLVIPDGADGETARALPALPGVRVLDDRGPRGGAAALNRLFRETDAGVVVLLESGCLVAPGWLDALLGALNSAPRAGLAGPSTNRAWNEQGVFTDASPEALVATAAEARRHFGSSTRTLGPLFSLGDFCYAVRREVFDAIGDADESYGLGPCWEMDFNVRAARAGFDGLWVSGAYVWRAPFTARREREEAARFEVSRRRYQDKFCGGRLAGTKRDYREHCRGDLCPNFAPAHVVASNGRRIPLEPVAAAPAPLVSCIMPTADRRGFIPQAVAGFLGQDYANLELIVVDDGQDAIADILPSDRRIRYVRLPQRASVGAKRNIACEHARGEFIVHWDDDDWYPASRVRVQVRALVDRGMDVCGTSVLYYVDRSQNRAFCYRYSGGGLPWVAGNTLAYRRELWRRKPFADVQVGEDAQFVWSSTERLVDLRDPSLCVASLHGTNVSPKDTSGVYWTPESVDTIRAVIAHGAPASPLTAVPLVSCIMPTYNRRPFIRLALARFREQTYPNRELLVIDDGRDGIGDLVRDEPAVRYLRIDARLPIGAKRNRACAEARGEIIAHWDDDDWYSPDRLERQATPIVRGEADITGLENRFVLQVPDRRFWTVDPRLHKSMFVGDVHGGTLVFRRSIWTAGIRYPEVDLAEDAMFLQQATGRGNRLLKLENQGSFVYMRHSRNAWSFTAGSFLDPSGWRPASAPHGFSEEGIRDYATAASQLAG
jgi:glycosyltransferase involved in cell wall biosynthesis